MMRLDIPVFCPKCNNAQSDYMKILKEYKREWKDIPVDGWYPHIDIGSFFKCLRCGHEFYIGHTGEIPDMFEIVEELL